MDSYVTVSEAARIKKVTRQAIYLAIRLQRLKAYKHNDGWKIFKVDLEDYDNNIRYSRIQSTYKGELIFNEDKGYISIQKAAEMLGIPVQKLYYAARTEKLKAVRKRASWVIYVPDLFEYQDKYLKKELSENGTG